MNIRLFTENIFKSSKKFPAPKKVFFGWWIAIGGSIAMAIQSGINFHGFGNFIIPLEDEFGSNRTVTSAIFSFARLEQGVIGPVEGWLVDRVGPRKMMLIGIPLMSVGWIILSRVDTLLAVFFVYVGVITLGSSMGVGMPCATAVANWFKLKRGMAFGIMWAGVGVGGLLVPGIGWVIDSFGWRNASVVIGIGVLLLGLPIAALMRHKPEPYGYLPDGVEKSETNLEDDGENMSQTREFSASQALRTSSFWYLAASIGVRSLVSGGIGLHLIAYFIGLGMTPVGAAALAGSVGLMSIPGRFGLSVLGDYFNRRYVMVISLGMMSGVMLLMSTATSIASVIPALFAYAVAQGGIAVIPQSLIADYFGRKSYATIQGFRSSVQMIGIISGPILAGLVYDSTGSYQLAFYMFAVASLIAMFLAILAKPPKQKST